MLKTLLLNGTYESIAFIDERKLFKLLANDKVDILAEWNDKITFGRNNVIKHPAVVKLKYYVRWIPKNVNFKRYNVFKRDQLTCQYCGQSFPASQLTWDHIFPKSRGGKESWKNCVTACRVCNNKKGPRTPEEAQMPLIKKPHVSHLTVVHDYNIMSKRHEAWKDYIISD